MLLLVLDPSCLRRGGSVCCFFPLFFSSRGARGHAVVMVNDPFFGSSVFWGRVMKNPYDLRSQIRFCILPEKTLPWMKKKKTKKNARVRAFVLDDQDQGL